MITAVVAGAAGLVLTAGLMAPLVSFLTRRAVLDLPDERSSHRTPTPRGGGLAIAVAVPTLLVVPTALTGSPAPGSGALAVAVIGFAAIGLYEDVRGVQALLRLVLQVCVALAVAPILLRGAELDGRAVLAAVAVAALWLVSYANAVNFMDGIDGISAGHAAVTGAALAAAGGVTGTPVLLLGGLVVLGAVLGFAPWNLPRSRVFLGDVGSYALGSALAALVVAGVSQGVPLLPLAAPLVPYLTDTATTLVRRARLGEPLLQPHRMHVYQRLTDLGMSHVRVAAVVTGLGAWCAVLGLSTLTTRGLPATVVLTLLGGTAVGYVRLPHLLAAGRKRSR